MKIGIASPFNPNALKGYLYQDCQDRVFPINISATSVNNIVKSLLDSGNDVWVFTVGNSFSKLDGDKLHVVIVEGTKWNTIFPNLGKLACKIQIEINRYLDKIQVLHAQWCYEYALAVEPFVGRIPVFCTIRDWAPVIYSQISVRKRLRNVLFKIYWKYKIYVFNKIITNDSIYFVANSEYTADLFKRSFPSREITIIHNSIEDEKIVKKPSKHGKKFISIAMSLEDGRKNIKTLIKAFASFCEKVEGYQLVLVGNYHPNSGVFDYAKALGIIDKIDFTGVSSRDHIIELIDDSICMVHPAFEETFGNIVIEAMARGVLVIGGKESGAIPYVLKHGDIGMLCNVYDWEDICAKMEYVIKDETYYHQTVEKAMKAVWFYSNSQTAMKHLTLYNQVLEYDK